MKAEQLRRPRRDKSVVPTFCCPGTQEPRAEDGIGRQRSSTDIAAPSYGNHARRRLDRAKTLEDGRRVKFIYQENAGEDGAFITAQIEGNERRPISFRTDQGRETRPS